MKDLIKSIPILGKFAKETYWRITTRRPPQVFHGSRHYWQDRYAAGGNSGVGSYGKFAEFKAEVINDFVAEKSIISVIEFGCGDGNQLKLSRYQTYIGFDVSKSAVQECQKVFGDDSTKAFYTI